MKATTIEAPPKKPSPREILNKSEVIVQSKSKPFKKRNTIFKAEIAREEEEARKYLAHKREVQAKYNRISKTGIDDDGKYRYILIWGNNSDLVKTVLDTREWWVETPCTTTMFQFKWQPFSKGIRFDYLTEFGLRKMVNHFEYEYEISQKDTLFKNMLKYCDSQKKEILNFMPITFIIDFTEG